MTREEVDIMALRYLRDNGPDTPGVIDSDEKLAAWMVYVGLVGRGLVSSSNFGGGMVQFSITAAGLELAA